jgi:hypothetical protein
MTIDDRAAWHRRTLAMSAADAGGGILATLPRSRW